MPARARNYDRLHYVNGKLHYSIVRLNACIKNFIKYSLLCVTCAQFCCTYLYAQDAGSRAAYTRGGWAGARYVGMGKAAEVVADDVYSIYWNPAGLIDVKRRAGLSSDTVHDKVSRGDISKITEKDLIQFSEEGGAGNFFQTGVSAALLDIDREAGFAGIAFPFFRGVAGCGVYTIQSRNIEGRDESGAYTGDLIYRGSVGYLSYGWISGVASMGLSVKALQERIADHTYYGGGCDFGANVDILPVLRVGFVIQDIGTHLYDHKSDDSAYRNFDFGYPTLKLSAAFTDRSGGFTIAMSGVKRVEQDKYIFNAGISYALLKSMDVYLGMSDLNFSSGVQISFSGLDIGYAFIIDKISYGFNNIISIALML